MVLGDAYTHSARNCYRPRSDRTFGLFWAELLSQLATIVTPVIRCSLPRPFIPYPATRF